MYSAQTYYKTITFPSLPYFSYENAIKSTVFTLVIYVF